VCVQNREIPLYVYTHAPNTRVIYMTYYFRRRCSSKI